MMKKIAIIIAAAIVAVSAFAQEKRWAVVNLSTVYMRAQPDYESALETQELMGTVVEIVGEKGYWREIVSPQPYKAWVTEKGLIEMSEAQLEEYKAAPKVMFAGLYGHVYTGPSLNSATVCDLVGGDLLDCTLAAGMEQKAELPGQPQKKANGQRCSFRQERPDGYSRRTL